MLLLAHSDERGNKTSRRLFALAWVVWGAMFAFVAFRASKFVFDSNECLIYGRAAQNWWGRANLYDLSNIDGFLYLPQAAILYTPFALAGHPLGDVAWRFCGLSVFCWGLWRLGKILSPASPKRVFAYATFLAFAPAFNALRNAQVNLPLAGLMLHTAVDLAQRRWWRAAAWMTIGLAMKPIMIVMILLAGACYRGVIRPLAICLLLLAVFPFLMGPWDYVVSQMQMFFEKLLLAGAPDRLFSDLRSLVGWLGFMIPMPIYLAMQVAAALVTLWLGIMAVRRWPEPAAATFILALSASYLMLFNPRTEGNSYVILTPVLVIPVALMVIENRRREAVLAMIVLTACLTGNLWAYKLTVHWLKPAACILFVAMMVRELLRGTMQDWAIDRQRAVFAGRRRVHLQPAAKAASGFSNISKTLVMRQR